MNQNELLAQVNDCATFFYQNKEQEAYQLLNQLLPQINQILQLAAAEMSNYQETIIFILKSFLDAYQLKDNLALADILKYEIINVIELTN